MFKRLGFLLDKLHHALSILVGSMIMFMMLIISADVITRYIFGTQILSWATEICEWLILLTPFLGGGWLLSKDGHIKIDILIEKFSKSTQELLRMIMYGFAGIACVIFTYHLVQNAYQDAITGYYKISILNLPRAPFEFIMSFGLVVLILEFIRQVYRSGLAYKSVKFSAQATSKK